MKNNMKSILSISAFIILGCMLMTGCSSKKTIVDSTFSSSASMLSAPTNFQFDPLTGQYSFTPSDTNAGYYYIRIFAVIDGIESPHYSASSERINATTTETVTGQMDVSAVAWGINHVNLVTAAAAGTDYASPDPTTLTYEYGVDQPLERPEMMAITSGNQVELIVDWWTLCDYYIKECMPKIKFTIYSDEACTQEVKSDTYDLSDLINTLSMTPTGLAYVWGYTTSGLHMFYPEGEMNFITRTPAQFAYSNNIYTYTLDAGTYYATCQALSKYDFINDSKVSTVVKFTLTDEEPTSEYQTAATQLWTDPGWFGVEPGANPGMMEERVDSCLSKPISVRPVD